MVLDYVVPTPKGTTWGKMSHNTWLESCQLDVGWLLIMSSGLVIRSWRNMRECGLHSQEADAPDGFAWNGHAGCTQVWLGV